MPLILNTVLNIHIAAFISSCFKAWYVTMCNSQENSFLMLSCLCRQEFDGRKQKHLALYYLTINLSIFKRKSICTVRDTNVV